MTLRWCAMFVILLLTVAPAQAQQTRAYGPDGRSLGRHRHTVTAAPALRRPRQHRRHQHRHEHWHHLLRCPRNVTGRATATGGRR